jgi:hypothetical protein
VIAEMAVPLLVALALALVCWWGRKNAESVVSASLPHEVREREVRVLRRGIVACGLVAALFLVLALLPVAGELTRSIL